jgi:hypothetical protein
MVFIFVCVRYKVFAWRTFKYNVQIDIDNSWHRHSEMFTHVVSCISISKNLMFTRFEYLTSVTFLGSIAIKPDEGATRLHWKILKFYHATQLENHARTWAFCYRSFTWAEGFCSHLRVESVFENGSLEDFSPIVSALLCPYNSSNAPHSYFIHSPPTQLHTSLN